MLERLFNSDYDKEVEESVQDSPHKKERTAFDGVLEIIIVSDNHRARKGLAKVVEYHSSADHFLHCGDSNLESGDEAMKPFVTVRGNTDYFQGYQEDEFIQLPFDERIWVTHGHRYSVNSGISDLIMSAKLGRAMAMAEIQPIDIVFYGHTHKVDVKMQEGILVINPGSISRPRDGVHRTYARLVITTDFYDVQVLDISDHSVLKEFQFPRE